MQFCMAYQIKLNVHLLYSFVHVFIHNSITKCFFGKCFAKPLAKAFRKTSNDDQEIVCHGDVKNTGTA